MSGYLLASFGEVLLYVIKKKKLIKHTVNPDITLSGGPYLCRMHTTHPEEFHCLLLFSAKAIQYDLHEESLKELVF